VRTSISPQVIADRPPEALRDFVRRLLVIESGETRRDEHLPGTGAVAAFTFRGSCRWDRGENVPRAALTGVWDTVRTHDHSRDHAVVVVHFTATGAAGLLRDSLEEFVNRTADLTAALDDAKDFAELPEQLTVQRNHRQRLALVGEVLLRHFRDVRPDPLVQAAAEAIARVQGMIRVTELTRQVGLSQSALERRFRRVIGVSPRKFASLVRLRHAVRLRETGADFTTVAHAAGYSDQSHFVHDFKRFTGVAPRAYFARASVAKVDASWGDGARVNTPPQTPNFYKSAAP
jgi:AraC-like DNA-binding protein